ncbi:MAG: phage recombination protein Bet, partial [Burkholderiales bacterium]|nr:phage recombination protein Bet [Burkholderiales bacterium]
TSIAMAVEYCKAANLDVMQKPVHIVPMWDGKSKRMRDVIMPGIGLYRIMAARTGQFAGMSEPEYGPDVTETIGGVSVTYPAWCKIVVRRQLASGLVAEFPAIERWKECYAIKGGPEKSIAPNAMWFKRAYGQLAKCAEASALRKAFPEFGAAPTAEEMLGKSFDEDDAPAAAPTVAMPQSRSQPEVPETVEAEVVEQTAQKTAAPAQKTAEAARPTESGNITEGEVAHLVARLQKSGKTVDDLCTHFGLPVLADLPKARFQEARKWTA